MRSDTLRMFNQYTKVTLKSWFQYKVDAVMRSFAVFFRESTSILVIYFTLLKFNNLNGWNINEMLFLYSLLFLTYGILIVFFTGLRDFERYIHEGRFDRFMLRPRGLLFQVISSNSDWFAALGQGGLGIVLFVMTANRVGIVWNVKTVVYYIMAVVGGVLIQGAIFLVLAAFNFYWIKTESVKEVLYWNLRKFAGYPISIFHKSIQYLLIYVVPFAFVNYFPTQYLLRKFDLAVYPKSYIYMTPIVGIVMYSASYVFWRISIKHYNSTGN
jgi:ABC-2 type transport system permease protein